MAGVMGFALGSSFAPSVDAHASLVVFTGPSQAKKEGTVDEKIPGENSPQASRRKQQAQGKSKDLRVVESLKTGSGQGRLCSGLSGTQGRGDP